MGHSSGRAARHGGPWYTDLVDVPGDVVDIPGLLHQARVVGLGGSRAPGAETRRAVQELIQAVDQREVHVGDAPGVDTLVRTLVSPPQRVDYDVIGLRTAHNLVERTLACITEVVLHGPHAVWVALPDTACPFGLVPHAQSRVCFAGQRNAAGRTSGTWKGLAYVAGLRLRDGYPRAVLYLPGAYALPTGWGFRAFRALPGWWEVIAAT